MRFLKNKILLAEEARQRREQKSQSSSPSDRSLSLKISPETINLDQEIPHNNSTRRMKPSSPIHTTNNLNLTFTKPTKNIIINYGKALASFAASDLADPYIKREFGHEKVDVEKFKRYANEAKAKVAGYESFESLLAATNTDAPEMVLFKKMLRKLGEVFIKYFSVNWIIHGRVTHKLVYLKHRSIVLRRIQSL